MAIVLLTAFGLVSLTVIVHAFGALATLLHLSRTLQQIERQHTFLVSEVQIAGMVGVLLLLHLVEAGAWAGCYWVSGVLPDLETSIYFSLASYTTVGYGDVVLPSPWRILGPIEAAVGILMFGWSTAIIVAAVSRTYRRRLSASPRNSTVIRPE